MKQIVQISLIIITIVTMPGCATIMSREYPSLRLTPGAALPPCYPATVTDLYFIFAGFSFLLSGEGTSDTPSSAVSLLMIPGGVLDLPLSLVSDTILFPLDFKRRPPKKDWSQVFSMAIGTATTNAPGLILLDTSARHSPNPPKMAPWAIFRDESSGQSIKVTGREPFGCADSPDRYTMECFYRDKVEAGKVKQEDSIQQAPRTRR
jgi:uncharacterized protein YceK